MTTIGEYNSAEHALQYLARADRIAHRTAGEAVVLELVPRTVRRPAISTFTREPGGSDRTNGPITASDAGETTGGDEVVARASS